MFERFTREARQTVVQAQAEAAALRHPRVGTEHLLLGLVGQEATPTAAVLARHGLTRATVLESVVDAGRRPGRRGAHDARDRPGRRPGAGRVGVRPRRPGRPGPPARCDGRPGTSRSTPRAKKVLELSLREALALKHRHIADGHIALGLLREGEGLAMKVLADRGIDPVELRREITAALGS